MEIACGPRGLGREPSSESEIVPQPARPRRGRTVVLGCGPSADRASWNSGEDLGVWEELEELHGVRVQSDNGVVIIGGFFLSRITVKLAFFPFGSEEDGLPWFAVIAESDKVVGTVGPIA